MWQIVVVYVPIAVAIHATKELFKYGATNFGDGEENQLVRFYYNGRKVPSSKLVDFFVNGVQKLESFKIGRLDNGSFTLLGRLTNF